MFQAKLMDDKQVQIFIDNVATPCILPLSINNKYPILKTYPKTESTTPIHTGGSMIESHFWIEIPLKLDNQVIQIWNAPMILCWDIHHWHNFLHGKIMLQRSYTYNKSQSP